MESTLPDGRKTKKRKIEKLEGWGTRSSLMEEEKVQEGVETQAVQKWDWKDVTDCLIVDTGMEQKSKQASITDWTRKEKYEARTIQEGRMERKENKKPRPPLKRKRGKLSKKEEVEMKKRHRDIS